MSLHRDQSRRKLSRLRRQPRQLSRQPRPQMLVCLHEDHVVSIAHGYAKVRPADGLCVHSNVGLMHGMMGIFNAWCDRVPMFVFGANRSGRFRETPSVDRLDPHLQGSRRYAATFHQVGR